MSRAVALLLVVVLLVPAVAQAQETPFGPVPTEAPTADPVAGTDDGVSRATLYLIGLGVLAGVVGIGIAISRDARRSLTPEDREAIERQERGEPPPGSGSTKEARARAKQRRAKVKAARRARRHNR